MCIFPGCSNPDPPNHGTVMVETDTNGVATAVYSCSQGYYLDGQATRRCLLTNKWDGYEPFCAVISEFH